MISTYTPSIPHLSNEELQEKINDALQGLLYYQLIEKWQVEVFDMEIFEETYTLSDNGYKLLKYWQVNMFFFA
ncbi:hypothetical protein ACS2TZ_45575, partial [Bacillus cereus group sp. Bce025]